MSSDESSTSPVIVNNPWHSLPTSGAVVPADRVAGILANRLFQGNEQYLIRWRNDSDRILPTDPCSWHTIDELRTSLYSLQQYLEDQRRQSSSSKNTDAPNDEYRIVHAKSYNGSLKIVNGQFDIVPFQKETVIDATLLPTPAMMRISYMSTTSLLENCIRFEFTSRLKSKPGSPVTFENIHDATTLSLKIHLISDYIITSDVQVADPGTLEGCECKPDMGRNKGCEYTKTCQCLEFAMVYEPDMTIDQDREREQRRSRGDLSNAGFPKKFPYKISGQLTDHYLNSRAVIYECNPLCGCVPNCAQTIVQKGCQVPLVIKKTPDRGFGLFCPVDLPKGTFIGCYLGEVITRDEANRRESERRSKGQGETKSNYLFDLDKFTVDSGEEARYTIDGEFYGGATRWMNHSCKPNCRQYAVCTNKYDTHVYNLAFFTVEAVPAHTELTFDYLDLEDDQIEAWEQDPEMEKKKMECKCGAPKCRGWLFR